MSSPMSSANLSRCLDSELLINISKAFEAAQATHTHTHRHTHTQTHKMRNAPRGGPDTSGEMGREGKSPYIVIKHSGGAHAHASIAPFADNVDNAHLHNMESHRSSNEEEWAAKMRIKLNIKYL